MIGKNVPAFLGLGLLRLYRHCVSPLLPPSCRFYPTCSQYACEVIKRFGLLRGGALSVRRLLKCHPFYRGPLYDPPPSLRNKKAPSSD